MAHAVPFAVFVLLCVVQLGVCLKATTTPPVTKDKDRHGCEMPTYPCSGGMPGIPGANGMPGIPGPYGARGDKGARGEQGRPGAKGDLGGKGDRGQRGQNGSPGKTGPNGSYGKKGEPGSFGAKGDAGWKGEKGDVAASGPISASNWKQCVWKNINSDLDSGKIKECSFNKLQDNTALKVSFQGNLRIVGDNKCNRWYFKFNGNECSGPMAIDALVFNDWPSSGNPNLHAPRSFDGYCENLARGTVTVELWVGSCSGKSQGNAYTGWNSVSRIMVEEVARSQ